MSINCRWRAFCAGHSRTPFVPTLTGCIRCNRVAQHANLACLFLAVHNGLTIRSSGPLRRSALSSCGGQQRPLNSSVRPQKVLGFKFKCGFSRALRRIFLALLFFVRLFGCLRGRSFARAIVAGRCVTGSPERGGGAPAAGFAAPASRAQFIYSAAGALSAQATVVRLRCQRSPAAFVASARRTCNSFALVLSSAQWPNYSFKRTADVGLC